MIIRVILNPSCSEETRAQKFVEVIESLITSIKQEERENKTVSISKVDFYTEDELYCDWYKCRNCEETDIAEDFNYCPNCGVRINWIQSLTEEDVRILK